MRLFEDVNPEKCRPGILTKIASLPNPRDPRNKGLRTKMVTGVFQDLPKVGKRFTMVSEPLEAPGPKIRYINTSPIKKVTGKVFEPDLATYEFDTQNSSYKLEIPR